MLRRFDAFPEAPELEAVYIATPNHLHAPLTLVVARAGKAVMCEKPMATSLAKARAMVEACREANVRHATAFDQGFHALHQRLARLVRQGFLGTVTAARVHYACWTPRDWAPEPGCTTTGALAPLGPEEAPSSTSRRTASTCCSSCSASPSLK